MQCKYIYRVYKNGELYFTGDRLHIQEKLHCGVGVPAKYSHSGKLLYNEYSFEIVGEERRKKPVIKPRKKDINRVEIIYNLLKLYGNTCSNANPEIYREELRQRGIEFTYRKVKDDIGEKNRKDFYVLEVVNGKKEKEN